MNTAPSTLKKLNGYNLTWSSANLRQGPLKLSRVANGWRLLVTKSCERPINIFYVLPKRQKGSLKITLDKDVSAKVREFFVEESARRGSAAETTKVTNNHKSDFETLIELGARARLVHLKINLAAHLNVDALTEVSQDHGSFYKNFFFGVGELAPGSKNASDGSAELIATTGRQSINQIEVKQKEAGARTVLDGLFLAGNEQKIINKTRVWQKAPEGVVRQEYRGLARQKGQAVFDGLIDVKRSAARARVAQFSRNLVLSEQAQIETRPQLILNNHTLQARHGASVSRPAQDQIFYLRQRGFAEKEAQKMLSLAFAGSSLASVTDSDIKKLLKQKINQWL